MARKSVRVFIPTTQGPAEISLLERIDARARRSMATVSKSASGDSRVAGFDQSYDNFVRDPGGIIERLVGHATFRLETDKNISAGSSWQLAVFLAHVLEAQLRLCVRKNRIDSSGESGGVETLIWATGRVGIGDSSVGDVGHVARKIATSLPLFREYRAKGVDCLVFLPCENIGDINPLDRAALAELDVTVIPVSSCEEVLGYLGLQLSPMAADAVRDQKPWPDNPYPGLRPFTEELWNVFFGRGRAPVPTFCAIMSLVTTLNVSILREAPTNTAPSP